MPADPGVLTAEFKVNLLSPATSSDSLLAEGQVVRASPRPAERLSAAAEVGVADQIPRMEEHPKNAHLRSQAHGPRG